VSEWVSHRSCIFCGSRGPLTDEHALPHWAANLLGTGTNPPVIQGPKGRPIRLRIVAPQTLCHDCNNLWLGQYEDRFKALLGAAILGEGPIPLSRDDQEFAALWAIKTALLLELAVRLPPWRLNPIPLPDSVFRWMQLHKTPPPGASVWIGTTGPGPDRKPDQNWRYGNIANHPITLPNSDWPIGNIITFHVQFLLFKVCVVQVDGTEPEPIRVPRSDPHFLQIWPVASDLIEWPALGLSWTDFDTLRAQLWPVALPPDAPPMKPWPLIPKESNDWR